MSRWRGRVDGPLLKTCLPHLWGRELFSLNLPPHLWGSEPLSLKLASPIYGGGGPRERWKGTRPSGARFDALAGVRVQKVQRVQRFDTAFGREGCGGRLRRQYECRLRRRPPLVPYGTTFPPQAGAQQGSARHFFHKLLYGKHGLFCHPASDGTTKLREAEYKMRLPGRHHNPWAQRAHQT